MNPRVHRHREVRVVVVGASPGSVQAEADGSLHEWAEHVILVFDEDELRLAVCRRGRRGLIALCGDLEFDLIVAAGIRPDGSPGLQGKDEG